MSNNIEVRVYAYDPNKGVACSHVLRTRMVATDRKHIYEYWLANATSTECAAKGEQIYTLLVGQSSS